LLSLVPIDKKITNPHDNAKILYFGELIRHSVLDDIAELCDPKAPKISWLEAVKAPGDYEKGEIPYSRFIQPKASEYQDLSLKTC
jgi:hypothetical protein